MNTSEKKSIRSKTTGLAIMLILCATTLFAYMTTEKTSISMCEKIKVVLHNEIMPFGKISCDSAVFFMPAKDPENAFKQANNICVKLGAWPSEKNENSQTYILPQNNGKITLLKYNSQNNIYVIIFMKISCKDINMKEIRYVSLNAFSKIENKTN